MKEKSKVLPGLICGDELSHIREAVCITVEKVYDACKELQCARCMTRKRFDRIYKSFI